MSSISFPAVHDRSGPFERSNYIFDNNQANAQQAPTVGMTPSVSSRTASMLHQIEHNPFETSFESFAHPHKHSPPPLAVPREKKRPRISQLQTEGSGSDSNSQPSSYNTVPSTATESGNESSNSPSFQPGELFLPASRIEDSTLMSRSLSGQLAPQQRASVTQASASDYEQLVRAYAQNKTVSMQAAPKALPPGALQNYRPAPLAQPIAIVAPQSPTRPFSGGEESLIKLPAKRPISTTPQASVVIDDEGSPEFRPGRKLSKKAKKAAALQVKEIQLPKDEDEERRSQFLERNRLAACKSRQKKKEWIAGLEATAEDLTRQNQEMQTVITALRDEVTALRSAMAGHTACSCQGQSQTPQLQVQTPLLQAPKSPKKSFEAVPMQVRHSIASISMSSSTNSPIVSPRTITFGNDCHSFSPPNRFDYFTSLNSGMQPTDAFNTPDLASQLGF